MNMRKSLNVSILIFIEHGDVLSSEILAPNHYLTSFIFKSSLLIIMNMYWSILLKAAVLT